MSIDADTNFSRAIEEHLSLKKRNAGLSGAMPIERYEVADPMENHPLFKSEEQARLEETFETMPEEPLEFELASEALEATEATEASEALEAPDAPEAPAVPATNALPWPGQGDSEGPALDEGLWGKSRDFDWGE